MEAYLHQPMTNAEWVSILMLVSIACGSAVTIAGIVTGYYRRTQLDEIEATLKLEMIHRGMAPDEIKKVLQARSTMFDPDVLAQCRHRHARRRNFWKQERASRV